MTLSKPAAREVTIFNGLGDYTVELLAPLTFPPDITISVTPLGKIPVRYAAELVGAPPNGIRVRTSIPGGPADTDFSISVTRT